MAARLPISHLLGTGTAPTPYTVPAGRHFTGAVHMVDPTDNNYLFVKLDGVNIGSTQTPALTGAPTRLAPLVLKSGQILTIAGSNDATAVLMGFEMDNPT